MAEQFKYDAFLSHSSKDKAVVRNLAERLRTDGLRIWFDEWEIKPGDSIPAKVDEGLERSRVLLFCMSENAFGSEWGLLESYTFRFRDPLNRERRFIPIRLDESAIKGTLQQFRYIKWLPENYEQTYPELLAACHPDNSFIPRKEPNPQSSARPVTINPGKNMRIIHNGSGDIVMGNKSTPRPKFFFTPGPQHITAETAKKLSDLVKEIVERLTVSGGNTSKAFQTVWGEFNEHFGLTTYKELPRERAAEGVSYLYQWRASKDSKLRFADPEVFRSVQLKGIWPKSKQLGFSDNDLYAFAAKKLKLKAPISSLNDLENNNQLARLHRFLRYEVRKSKKDSEKSLKSESKNKIKTQDLSRVSTEELIAIVTQLATARQLEGDSPALREVQSRSGYVYCPNADLAAFTELDRKVLIPLFGRTKLPPGIIHLPGAKYPPPPLYYQNRDT